MVMSPLLTPSLTQLSPTVTYCALVTPVRSTVIVFPLTVAIATEPVPTVSAALPKVTGEAKVTTIL